MDFRWFVNSVYANHGRSARIRLPLGRCLRTLDAGGLGLNVGGESRLHPSLLNLNNCRIDDVDCLGDAELLPFRDHAFDLVVTQATLEHVKNPDAAMLEIYRVLKPGGLLLCQLPFFIGYHPGPTDFWRFTRQGIVALVERAGFRCEEVRISVGPGIAFSNTVTEFCASLVSAFLPFLYRPVKGIGAMIFYPFKWLDPILLRSRQADRLAGEYMVIARR